MKKQVQQVLLRLARLACLSLLLWAQATHAQTVTQSWAALASGATPYGLAIDASGNVYTANYSNTVSKVTSAGGVTQSWATLASNAFPQGGIAIDASGNVYTANLGNNTVSKITPAGSVQTLTGFSSGTNPGRIAIDASGNLYTSNAGNNTVSKIQPDGSTNASWAVLASGASPAGIAIDASGNVYTANNGNSRVNKITPAGGVQTLAALASGATPHGIAIDASGNVYTANFGNHTVSKITPAGLTYDPWASLASGAGPYGIAIDASGNVYTANALNHTVSKITSAGDVTQSWAVLASGANPAGIAIDASGNVYTSNVGNNTVSKIAPAVLPVELLDFTGKNREGGNLLTWATASEVNNKGFQVERLNGNDWQNIGFKTANNKASNYQFTDNTPLSISSYRLRQIDNDGTETLSKIITIQNKGTKGKLAVYPNPVANVLTVELDSPLWGLGAGNFQILNLLGQQVLTGKTAQRIDVSALPQGSYVLKVGAEQVKFIKQ